MSKKKIKLYGDMGKRFGRVMLLEVDSAAEAIRALCVIKPGFRQYLQDHLESPFRVLVGEDACDEAGLQSPVGRTECIKIVPVVGGAKSGFGQILIGAALIIASIYCPPLAAGGSYAWAGNIAYSMGVAMCMGGVASILAGNPSANFNPNGDSDKETSSFGSPTLTTGQGGCVPWGCGKMRIGGHIISAGIDAQTWTPGGFDKDICLTDDGTQYGNGDSVPWMWAIGA